MNRSKTTVGVIIASVSVVAVVAVWYLIQPGVLFKANQGTGLLLAKYWPMHALYFQMRDDERLRGVVPQTKDYYQPGLDGGMLQRDAATHRAYERAVLLHTVVVPSGRTYPWMLVLLVPKGSFSGPPTEDLIYLAGAGDLEGELLTVDAATKRFGEEVVKAAKAAK